MARQEFAPGNDLYEEMHEAFCGREQKDRTVKQSDIYDNNGDLDLKRISNPQLRSLVGNFVERGRFPIHRFNGYATQEEWDGAMEADFVQRVCKSSEEVNRRRAESKARSYDHVYKR